MDKGNTKVTGKKMKGTVRAGALTEPSAQMREAIEKAFCAGFVAGYSNADDSYPGPDEDVALAEYMASEVPMASRKRLVVESPDAKRAK